MCNLGQYILRPTENPDEAQCASYPQGTYSNIHGENCTKCPEGQITCWEGSRNLSDCVGRNNHILDFAYYYFRYEVLYL